MLQDWLQITDGRTWLSDVQAEKMVSQFEEVGNVLGDVGLALIAMAKYEDEDGTKTGSYTDSSAAAKDISADSRRVGMVRAKTSCVQVSHLQSCTCAGIIMLQALRAL